jgi:hypothetical protein
MMRLFYWRMRKMATNRRTYIQFDGLLDVLVDVVWTLVK